MWLYRCYISGECRYYSFMVQYFATAKKGHTGCLKTNPSEISKRRFVWQYESGFFSVMYIPKTSIFVKTTYCKREIV